LDVINEIYTTDLMSDGSMRKKVMLLEFSQYLENYLWPNFKSDKTSIPQIMSIVLMVNEKFRERVPAWIPFQKNPDEFPKFFERIMELSLSDDSSVNLKEQTALLVFLDHCFTSMEVDLVRTQIQKLVSVSHK
jgi:intron-binding protein aquarius